jgi:phosphatidylglycerol:prolipoprotein diacylglycerol transferase
MAITAEQVVDFSCLSLLGGILGARLFYVILQWEFFMSSPQEMPAIWRGGLVWYGGFLGGTLAGWFYVRAKRLVFLRVMDQFIPFLVLGHAIGRVGCFLNGCCYGKPTGTWCGLVLPGQATAVLPTQLFESLGLLVLYLVLRRLQRGAFLSRPGRLFSLYLMSYAALRFLMEFLRGDQTAFWAGLTLQQLIGLGLFVIGLGLSSVPSVRLDGPTEVTDR